MEKDVAGILKYFKDNPMHWWFHCSIMELKFGIGLKGCYMNDVKTSFSLLSLCS